MKPLRLLHVEDNPVDTELVVLELRRGGYEVSMLRVDTGPAMQTALTKASWDVVVADYAMPTFSAPEALLLCRRLVPDLPFIVVSGTIGEDTAVEMMRNGADDYLMKDSLRRLVPAIEHALQTAEDRRERRRAEEALRQSLQDYETLYKAIPGGIIVLGATGEILKVNDAGCQILRRPAEQLVGRFLQDVQGRVIGEDGSPIAPADFPLHATLGRGEPLQACTVGLQLDESGEITWLLANAEAILDPVTGAPTAAVVTCLDRTEHRATEEALRESERRFRDMADLMPDALYEIGPDLRLTYVNQAMCKMLGFSAAELLAPEAISLYTTPASREKIKTRVLAWMAGEELTPDIRELVRKDGVTIAVEVHADAIAGPSGEPVGVRGVMHDITARVRTQQALAASERRFREMADLMPDALVEYTPTGEHTYVNRAMREALGYGDDPSSMPTSALNFLDKETQPRALARWAALAEGAEPGIVNYEAIHRDGHRIPMEAHAVGVFDDNGQCTGIRGVLRDITERQRVEQVLRESEERFRLMYEESPVPYQSLDENGCITEVNPRWLEILGYEREEVIGRGFAEFVSPIERPALEAECAAFMQAGSRHGTKWHMLCKNGSTLIMASEVRVAHHSDGSFEQTHCTLQDITDAQRLQDEMLKTQKLESLGVLAGGIAHDFNNYLLVIMGNLQMARLFPSDEEIHSRQLRNSENACKQAQDLTGQLLTFARGGAPIKKTASITSLIRDTALFAVSGSNVKCTFELGADVSPVEADLGQISQVINNLVINADQAMPAGGTLRVAVEDAELDGSGEVPLPAGRYVRITVTDEGIGIAPGVVERIFDPYFTTKSKGNGLGLASCFSIIRNHDGHIGVTSTPGVGTTFTVHLPCSTKQVSTEEQDEQPILPGQGRLLVMDDEEAVRDFARMIFEEIGYEVEVACEGQEAIACYEQAMEDGQPFAAVVLDLTVRGGAGGKATIEQLLRIDPDVRAVVCSGYSADPVMANYRDYGFCAVVVKPYGVAELVHAVRRAIEEG